MDIDLQHVREFEFKLDAWQSLLIHSGAEYAIGVRAGHAWLTRLGDVRGIILGAGSSLVLDRPGPAFVLATVPTDIAIHCIATTCAERPAPLVRVVTPDECLSPVLQGDPGWG